MTATRDWPAPPAENTLHLFGDVHWGANVPSVASMQGTRGARISNDFLRGLIPDIAAEVQLGDFVNDGLTSQDAGVLPWFSALNDAPKYNVLGNHDMGGATTTRTAVEAAIAYGMPAPSYTVDMGFAKLIIVGPDGLTGGRLAYSQATVDWIDAQASADPSQPAFCFAHPPLYETVGAGADISKQFLSTETSFYMRVADVGLGAEFRSMLADNPNIKGWISGHTHTPMWEPTLVTTEVIGGRSLAHVNTSCVLYVGRGMSVFYGTGNVPIKSLYMSCYDDGVELRVRDHGAGTWGTFEGATKSLWVPL